MQKEVTIQDSFWSYYQKLVRETIVPYQYAVLNDAIEVNVEAERKDDQLPAGKSHALANFRIAAGLETGEHFGWIFQDSDVYKWIEAAAYTLEEHPDAQLEALIDEVVALIAQAQEKDGYIHTFYQLRDPKLKYRQLYFSHELYCIGHLIEAALAYVQATGKDTLLAIALRAVDNVAANFGEEEGKIAGADGHQEIELALGKLYEYTQDDAHLALAKFFLTIRGKDPQFYEKEIQQNLDEGLSTERPYVNLMYLQAYDQPKNQREAQGHAVRMLYMAAAMAKIANHTNDQEMYEACVAIWQNIVEKKLYLTGGVGSTVHGEAFTGDYDLPNDTMYCETCASIALIYFGHELFKMNPQGAYIDVLERALYNTVLAGAAVDGKHFFYVNPLEVHPAHCHHNPGKGHVKTQRPDWLGCACCPPNFARTVASLQTYIYAIKEEKLYVNLFVESTYHSKEKQQTLIQKTDFPYGDSLTLDYEGPKQKIFVRKPAWAPKITSDVAYTFDDSGYLVFELEGSQTITLQIEQPILFVTANPKVESTSGKIAIQKGPFVYCAEGIENGEDLQRLAISDKTANFSAVIRSEILEKTLQLIGKAQRTKEWSTSELYRWNQDLEKEEIEVTLIPYHLWGNRGETEMRIWFLNEKR